MVNQINYQDFKISLWLTEPKILHNKGYTSKGAKQTPNSIYEGFNHLKEKSSLENPGSGCKVFEFKCRHDNYHNTNDQYSPPELEVKFTLPLNELPPEIMQRAIAQAKESCVMELLKLGSISGGKASEILSINRSRLSELMYLYNISAFQLTVEDLTAEVGSALQDLELNQ